MVTKLSNPQHPIWDLAELILAVGIVAIVLWHNASNFDRTEHISIGQIGTLLAIVFGTRRFLQREKNEKSNSSSSDSSS